MNNPANTWCLYANVLKPISCSGKGIAFNIRYEIWDKDLGDDKANSLVSVRGTDNSYNQKKSNQHGGAAKIRLTPGFFYPMV